MADVTPPRERPFIVYVVVFAIYVTLGYFVKTVVLNWIVGPLFLLLALYVVPRALKRLTT